MRPPMHQKIFIKSQTALDEDGNEIKDRYGRPVYRDVEKKYPARVRRKANQVRDKEGIIYDADMEIDVPEDAPVEARMNIRFQNIDGTIQDGIIESITDSVNLSGTRVLFKVLIVDGK